MTRALINGTLSAAAVALGALLAAPAVMAAESGKITLTFANWAAAEGATSPGLAKVIQDFEKSHPNITIESQAISFTDISHQLVLRVRSGNPPDVAELAGNDTFLLGLTGKVEPLDAYIDAGLRSAIKASTLQGLVYKGKLIGFPWTLAPAGLWYNKAVMAKAGLDPEKPPTTIAELMDDLAAIKKSQPSIIPFGLDTTNRTFSLQSNWPWMQTFGANPLDVAGKGAQAQPMKDYLAWMREMTQKGYIQPGRKIGEFRPLAAQDQVAFTWDQVLLQGVIQNANKMSNDDFYKHWGVAALPKGPSGKSFTFEGGHQLVMFANSAHKEAAWEFIKYLSTAPDAIQTYTLPYESSLMPLDKAPSDALAAKLDTPIFNTFLKTIIPTESAPPYGETFEASATAVMAGVQQTVTSDTPIDTITASIQQNLARQ